MTGSAQPELAFLFRRCTEKERQLRRAAPPPRRGEAGQTTAELALTFPVVLLLALVLVQATLVLRDDLALANAAREAARAASVDPDPARAERAAAAVLAGATVAVGPRPPVGDLVTVRVSYRSATTVPLVGPLLPDPELVARATMRVER